MEIQDGLDVGEWGEWDTCPTGSYAAGIRLRVTVFISTGLACVVFLPLWG